MNGYYTTTIYKTTLQRPFDDFEKRMKPSGLSFTGRRKINETTDPVSFREAMKLMRTGFKEKVKNMFKSIIEHPVKTLATIAGTTLALGLLPLAGISMATGGAVLALGFGAWAACKTTYHIGQAVKQTKNQQYFELRNTYKNIGGDTLDIALSVPFVPQSVKAIKDQVKFGPAIGFSSEFSKTLRTNISETSGIVNKAKVLYQGNMNLMQDISFNSTLAELNVPVESRALYLSLKNLSGEEFINSVYAQLVKDMGYEGIAPELRFGLLPKNNIASYNWTEGSITFSRSQVNKFRQANVLEFLRHELEHMDQFGVIARTEGAGIKTLVERAAGSVADRVIKFENVSPDKYEAIKLFEIRRLNDKLSNTSIYEKIIESKGIIKAGTPEALKAEEYIQGLINYPDTTFMFFGPTEEYLKNILEVEAFKAGRTAGQNFAETANAERFAQFEAQAHSIAAPTLTITRIESGKAEKLRATA